MEENYSNQNDNYSVIDKKPIEKHCWKKCIGILIAAFLGGFLAAYCVLDQIAERKYMQEMRMMHHPMRIEKRFMDDMDRMYKHDMKTIDESFKKFDKQFDKMTKSKKHNMALSPFFMDPIKIKSEYEGDKYNVIVGLKPFQNDENKVNYNVQGRKLTIFGKSEIQDKEYAQDISFSQDFILPEKADIANITKIKEDNNLIISVPIKE